MQFYNIKETNEWKEEYYLTTLGNIDAITKNYVINYCQNNITKNNKFTWSLENDKKLGKVLADKAKNWVKYVFVLAENEAKNNMILLKNLEKNTQETIYFK